MPNALHASSFFSSIHPSPRPAPPPHHARRPALPEPPPLLEPLTQLHPEQRVERVRRDPEYQRSRYVRLLLGYAETLAHRCPRQAAEWSAVAVEIARRLPAGREALALALTQCGRLWNCADQPQASFPFLRRALDLHTAATPLHPATRTLIHWALASYNAWQGHVQVARDHIELAVELAFRLPGASASSQHDSDLNPYLSLRQGALFGRLVLELRPADALSSPRRRAQLLRDLEPLRPSVSLLGDRAHASVAWGLLAEEQLARRPRPGVREVLDAGERDDPTVPKPRLAWLRLLCDEAALEARHDPASWLGLAQHFDREGSALEAALVLLHGLTATHPSSKHGRNTLVRHLAELEAPLAVAPRAATAVRQLVAATQDACKPDSARQLDSARLRTWAHEILRAERASGEAFPVYSLYWRLHVGSTGSREALQR